MNLECPICFAVLRTSVFFTVCTLYNKLGVKTVKFTNPKSKRAPFNLITYFGAFLSKSWPFYANGQEAKGPCLSAQSYVAGISELCQPT